VCCGGGQQGFALLVSHADSEVCQGGATVTPTSYAPMLDTTFTARVVACGSIGLEEIRNSLHNIPRSLHTLSTPRWHWRRTYQSQAFAQLVSNVRLADARCKASVKDQNFNVTQGRSLLATSTPPGRASQFCKKGCMYEGWRSCQAHRPIPCFSLTTLQQRQALQGRTVLAVHYS
jgi:hypothetical protein